MYISIQKWGNSILHRHIQNGRDIKDEIRNFRPKLYIPGDGEYTSMVGGTSLIEIECDNFKEAKDFIDQSKYDGVTVYGQNQWSHNAIAELYQSDIKIDLSSVRTVFLDIEVQSDDGFPSPITAMKPIVSISHYDTISKRLFLFSLADWNRSKSSLIGIYDDLLPLIVHRKFDSERELLRAYLDFWCENYPMIVSGWNTNGFDMPYIYNRLVQCIGESSAKRLSPFDAVTKREIRDSFDNPGVEINVYGIALLDLQVLYRKFIVTPRENYRLGTIAEIEIGADKLDYSEEETLDNLYQTDPQKYLDYNALDSWLVYLINQKRKLIELAMFIAYTAKINLDEVVSPVKTWDQLIYTYCRKHKIIPALAERNTKSDYVGGFVKEVNPKMYNWIVSFDFTSLYPSIIRQWNMCPSTIETHHRFSGENNTENLIRHLESTSSRILEGVESDFAVSANTVLFRQGVSAPLPTLVTSLFNDRKTAKKKAHELKLKIESMHGAAGVSELEHEMSSFKTKEGAIKVLLNSLYGAMANVWFRFYDIRIAEAITLTGQSIIQFVEQRVNTYLDKVLSSKKDRCIAIDTDSTYFDLSDLIDKVYGSREATIDQKIDFMNKVSVKLSDEVISPAIRDFVTNCGCKEVIIEMKREALANRGFWTAKKKYALNVYDNEGIRYSEPEQKVMGLQLIQSSTPKFCRDALKEAVRIILVSGNSDELIEYVEDVKSEFFKLSANELSYPRSISEIDKWTGIDGLAVKGSPPNARAAVTYNYWIQKLGLDHYQRIKPGSKIRYIELLEPNPLRSPYVAFYTKLPVEFKVEDFVDKASMFEASFMSPLRDMCKIVGMQVERFKTVEDFFG